MSSENYPHLTPEALAAFQWLASYVEQTGMSRKELSEKLGYDESTISKILNCKYTGNPDHILAAVAKFRASVIAPPERVDEFPFVPTETSRTIWAYIDLLRSCIQRIGTLIGESQSGKTRSIKEWIARYVRAQEAKGLPHDVIYLQLPIGAMRARVIMELCGLRHISQKYSSAMMEMRFEKTCTRNTIIFIDEVQQCASRPRSGGRMTAERIDTLGYLRRLHDVTGCTVVLAATTEALEMLGGSLLVELKRRSIPTYHVRPKPTVKDLNAFASHLGLPPATGAALTLQEATISRDCLGVWLMYIQAGFSIAAAQGRPVTWNDVLSADAIFQKGSGRK